MAHSEEVKRRTHPPNGGAPNFNETLALSDSLAQQFVKNYPSTREEQKWRQYFRGFCVPGLRWLWRTGDANTRTTLAARVAVWRERKTEDVRELQTRILARELGRKGEN